MFRSGALLLVAWLSLGVNGASVAKSVMHPAFKDAGRQDGIQIWRIQSFEPVPIQKVDFGKFYEGDSYIVLSTKEDKSKKGSFSWDIHFWLGKSTSQDESGAAAILAVELDDGLGGGPIQHREVQEHESQQFLNYFKSGVRYVPGGVASGFHHVDINAPGEKKLYQVKGKKNIRVRQVKPDISSMNKGDCFILDDGKDLYLYVGPKAKGTERLKAISAANQIRDQDHHGRAKVHIIDSNSSPDEVAPFFTALGSGSPTQVPNEPAPDDDQDFEKSQDNIVSLYKVSDAGGKLVSEKIGQKPLKKDMLKPEDCFILDTVTSGIFVWIGKGSNTQEKVEALKKGQAFLANNKYPAWTKMQRIVQGAEPTAFKEYFSQWSDEQLAGGLNRGLTRRARSANYRKCGPASAFTPDDGSGQIIITEFAPERNRLMDQANFGRFYSDKCYLVQYNYKGGRGDKDLFYLWIGDDAPEKQINDGERTLSELAHRGNGAAIKIRQGAEPKHFSSMFNGRSVVFRGRSRNDPEYPRLFQIRGTCERNKRAIELPCTASYLNTNDAFMLELPTKSYIWRGKHSEEYEDSLAQSAYKIICPTKELIIIREGEEPEEFWANLPGPRNYYKDVDVDGPELTARLFHCYVDDFKNRFISEEILDFDQKDLFPDDVMILDSGDEIYLWIGEDASIEEKHKAYTLANAYVSRSGNDHRRVIVKIKQGQEPSSFTDLFPNWDSNYKRPFVSLADLQNEIED